MIRSCPRRRMGAWWLVCTVLLVEFTPTVFLGNTPSVFWLEKGSDVLEAIGYSIAEPFEVYRRDLPEWRAIDLKAVGVLTVKSAFPVIVGRPLYFRFTFMEEIFANAEAADRHRDALIRAQRSGSIAQTKDLGVIRMFRIDRTLYRISTDVVMFEAELDRLTAGLQRLLKLEASAGLASDPESRAYKARRQIVEELRQPVSERLTIALVQQALNERAYDAGSADGLIGPRTRRALRAFQRATGLPDTGAIDSAVTNALNIPEDPIVYYTSQGVRSTR